MLFVINMPINLRLKSCLNINDMLIKINGIHNIISSLNNMIVSDNAFCFSEIGSDNKYFRHEVENRA